MNLTLIIFELTADQHEVQRKADELEIEADIRLEDCDKVAMTFHRIDYVKPAGQYCIVSSGGDLFTIYESADSVNQKIKERKIINFN